MADPFGGRVNFALYCTCSYLYWVNIDSAGQNLPDDLAYVPGQTTVYEYGQVTSSGEYLLGMTSMQKKQCKYRVGKYCITIKSNLPMMDFVGTSGNGGAGGGTGGSGGGGDNRSRPRPPADSGNVKPRPPVATSTPATSTPPVSKECTYDLGGWIFNSGIEKQKGDASGSLKSLLQCMCNELSQKGVQGKITSISDGHHIGRLYECRGSNYSKYGQCGSGSQCCYHSKDSCHYGGSHTDNKSYAADFGTANRDVLIPAAKSCGASYVANEGNHIHVSAGNCRTGN